jgi:hypothetical protein
MKLAWSHCPRLGQGVAEDGGLCGTPLEPHHCHDRHHIRFGSRGSAESGALPFGAYRQMLAEGGAARNCPVPQLRQFFQNST